MYGPREVELSPAVAVALCTLADVKAALGIAGNTYDTLLNGLIASASQAIETYCGTILGERDVTERRFACDANESVVLNYAPVSAVASVTFKDVAQTIGDFRLASRYATLRRVDGAAFAPGAWVFVYKAGFAAVDIPQVIKSAAVLYAKHLYNTTTGAVSEAIAKESTPDVGSIEYRSTADRTLTRGGVSLPAEIGLMLAPYIKVF